MYTLKNNIQIIYNTLYAEFHLISETSYVLNINKANQVQFPFIKVK